MLHSITSPPDQISRYLDNQCDDHCLAAAFKSLTCNLWYFSGLDDKMSMPEGKFPVIFAPFIIFPFYLISLISTTKILDSKLLILDTEYWRQNTEYYLGLTLALHCSSHVTNISIDIYLSKDLDWCYQLRYHEPTLSPNLVRTFCHFTAVLWTPGSPGIIAPFPVWIVLLSPTNLLSTFQPQHKPIILWASVWNILSFRWLKSTD